MFCPRCGKPVPAGAAFCPSCGSPTQTAATPPAPRAAAPSAPGPRAAIPVVPVTTNAVAAAALDQKRKNRMIAAGSAVAALVAMLFGLKAAGLLKLGAETPRPALQVRAEGPAPALALPAEVKPAPLQQGAERKRMPADVEEWLKHLERCEREKNQILSDQASKLQTMGPEIQAQALKALMPDAQGPDGGEPLDPGKFAGKKFEDLRAPWDALQRKFVSVPPPPECQPIAAGFNTGLTQTSFAMSDLMKVLNSLSGEPSNDVSSVKSTGGDANTAAAQGFKSADMGLTTICAKYDHSKWFDVKGLDLAGGGLMLPGSVGGTSGLSGGTLPGLGG